MKASVDLQDQRFVSWFFDQYDLRLERACNLGTLSSAARVVACLCSAILRDLYEYEYQDIARLLHFDGRQPHKIAFSAVRTGRIMLKRASHPYAQLARGISDHIRAGAGIDSV